MLLLLLLQRRAGKCNFKGGTGKEYPKTFFLILLEGCLSYVCILTKTFVGSLTSAPYKGVDSLKRK
jgi:hypothetical protein